MTRSGDRLGASSFAARGSVRQELTMVTDELIAEFAGSLPAGTVIRHVGQAREQLLAAGTWSDLPVAVATMARTRLHTLLPAHGAVI